MGGGCPTELTELEIAEIELIRREELSREPRINEDAKLAEEKESFVGETSLISHHICSPPFILHHRQRGLDLSPLYSRQIRSSAGERAESSSSHSTPPHFSPDFTSATSHGSRKLRHIFT